VISNRALNRATLARQLLLSRHDLGIVETVERLAGMQAQVAKPPAIGLWTRLNTFSLEAYREHIHRGDLVRATLMRGTIHLVSRRDFLAWRGPLQPVLTLGAAAITKSGGPLDNDQLVAAASSFLAKKPAVFDEIRNHLLEKFPQYNDRLMGYSVRLHLPLVMVPDDSFYAYPTNAAFARADLALGEPVPRHDNLSGLVLRYLAAFGPASVADFQTWSGCKGAKATFEALRPQLVSFRDEKKRELFDLPDAPRPEEDVDAPVRFLPEYDNLLLAYADRTRVISDEHRARIATKNLRILPTFLVDGVVAGSWSIEKKKIVLDPFVPLSRKTKAALEAEGEQLVKIFTK
jgi:hypothetical protein